MRSKDKLIKHSDSAVIHIRWIGADILVIKSKKEFNFFVKKNNFKDRGFSRAWDEGSPSFAYIEKNGNYYYVLFMVNPCDRSVVHECVHVVHFIFDQRGIDSSVENTETFAYMTDHMFEEVQRILTNDDKS